MTDEFPEATTRQRLACRSNGTKQCAAICLAHLPSWNWDDGCPEAARVWTNDAIAREQKRRPFGPLGYIEA